MNLEALLDALERSENAALILGAGISYPLHIPLGYALPMKFGEAHLALLEEVGLDDIWRKAASTPARRSKQKLRREKEFVDAFALVFERAPRLQETMLAWLQNYPAMQGVSQDPNCDPHAVFVLAWLRRVFRHLVTTNWDFVLEQQLDSIYEEAYTGSPFEPVEWSLSDGRGCKVEADSLFFKEPLDEDEFFWNPRWDVVANESDVAELRRWRRPLWKIHGSPFFLACPQCRGINRWKRTHDLHIGDVCPHHASERLAPEIIFWGYGVDRAYPLVWHALHTRLQRCDMVVVAGLSGGDTYIKDALQRQSNVWIVAPSKGEWDLRRVRFVSAYASDLSDGLFERFLG